MLGSVSPLQHVNSESKEAKERNNNTIIELKNYLLVSSIIVIDYNFNTCCICCSADVGSDRGSFEKAVVYPLSYAANGKFKLKNYYQLSSSQLSRNVNIVFNLCGTIIAYHKTINLESMNAFSTSSCVDSLVEPVQLSPSELIFTRARSMSEGQCQRSVYVHQSLEILLYHHSHHLQRVFFKRKKI